MLGVTVQNAWPCHQLVMQLACYVHMQASRVISQQCPACTPPRADVLQFTALGRHTATATAVCNIYGPYGTPTSSVKLALINQSILLIVTLSRQTSSDTEASMLPLHLTSLF
jgi:hypothetical protein